MLTISSQMMDLHFFGSLGNSNKSDIKKTKTNHKGSNEGIKNIPTATLVSVMKYKRKQLTQFMDRGKRQLPD